MSATSSVSSSYANPLSTSLNLPVKSVQATIALLEEGCTVPFIARYRKEATGSLDEVAIAAIRDEVARLTDLDKRRASIIESLKERDLLSADLEAQVKAATTKTELEDIYLPYRPKRKTRATAAIEKGLEPLALTIINYKTREPQKEAESFVNPEKGVATVEEALAGARDIIAEKVAEDSSLRGRMRKLWIKESRIESKLAKGKEQEGEKFKDYFDWSEPSAKAPSHRILAMFRGEAEKILKLSIRPEFERAVDILDEKYLKGEDKCTEQMEAAIEDAYKRLVAPSMETELRQILKERADEEAIKVFVNNLGELLMAPPLGQKAVLALDPGFRTGCKLVCLDRQGELLHHDVIYPLFDGKDGGGRARAVEKMLSYCKKYVVEAIAVGNGTASRETKDFVESIDFAGAGLNKPQVVLVNESGASIYSASKVARDEFPDHDVTVRGAVSIGRRLIDPLAELVKIEPKSIGVGQYQHDVDQGRLQTSLDDTVMSCVNSVGVELNTASKELLAYVSGLGNQLASNIVKFRQEEGPFASRAQLKKVPRLGPKAFEQCAGFLRIRGAKNPLDESAVHPERYKLVEKMASDLGVNLSELMRSEEARKKIQLDNYIGDGVGRPTLEDIFKELEKPGRDPREKLVPMEFAAGINSIGDLKEGMRVPGVITNVTNFGAFVDIGVHQDGLVHVSELADRFIKDPNEVVKVQQRVEVVVLKVEENRKRISLSMKR
ncbi:MAG: RNA-binding transcriptional accessory protein [Candidatus Obscuribacterales bacterium]|nr:RNA-binding transcriptional accessory protein [Candidatus Obscuribacterales bacterium]